MNKIAYKVGAGIVTASLLLSSVATAAFADVTAEISGNGAGSDNSIYIKHKSKCSVYQKNSTTVTTDIGSTANTGGNSGNGNTGSGVDIDTGDASSTVLVTVGGSSNVATNPCCCACDGCDSNHEDAIISGNGDGSTNDITIRKKKYTRIKQNNWTSVYTGVSSKSKTGRNRGDNNTGGTVDINTGVASSFVDVSVSTSTNTLNP